MVRVARLTRRLFLMAVPSAGFAALNCGRDRLCDAAAGFKAAWDEWANYRNTIAPESREFAKREDALWGREQRAHQRVTTEHG